MNNKLDKELPEYLPEFFKDLKKQILSDNRRWGDTWKQRGLLWNNKHQETRFIDWVNEKYDSWNNKEINNFPWLKVAGEAFIGYIREKYLK